MYQPLFLALSLWLLHRAIQITVKLLFKFLEQFFTCYALLHFLVHVVVNDLNVSQIVGILPNSRQDTEASKSYSDYCEFRRSDLVIKQKFWQTLFVYFHECPIPADPINPFYTCLWLIHPRHEANKVVLLLGWNNILLTIVLGGRERDLIFVVREDNLTLESIQKNIISLHLILYKVTQFNITRFIVRLCVKNC